MSLTGPQIGRIHKAILAAYARKDLTRVLLTCMDVDFDQVVEPDDFSAQVFALVRWANQRERALELLKYAHEENRTNTGLADLYAEAQAWGAPAPAAPPAAPPPPGGPHEIFLSYSHKDGALKARLLADLHAAGITVWIDDGLQPGTEEWKRAVKRAILECKCVIALLSPDAEQSKWVNIEIDFALEWNRPVIPLLARGERRDAVPLALFGAQYVDLRADFAGQVQGRLLPALNRHLGRSTPEPHKPKPPIAFDWVTIPAGEFLMGSDKARDKLAWDDELPQHRVSLPAFHVARVPVTNEQYLAFVRATGHRAPEHWQDGKIPQGMERHPVVNVSWRDARAFCAWASEVTGTTVRLPSEAEWEKAARGADGRIWPWGDELPTQERCNFNNNVKDTTPADAYPRGASPYGVLDMAGNVWEWTGSLFWPYPYDSADGREHSEAQSPRTLRGGAFNFNDDYVRCAYRFNLVPDYRYYYFGFRVVSPGF